MKLHPFVRICMVALMLVTAFIAGQQYSRPVEAQSRQNGNTRLSAPVLWAPVRSISSTSSEKKVGRWSP
jgi:hypothetical protein